MSDQTKPIHPLGWEAGREGEPAEIIKMLAIEMLGQRADLEHAADKAARDTTRQSMLRGQAWELERYAVALYAVAVQMNPAGYQVDHMRGLIDLAEKHSIALPDWMKGKTK